MDKMVGQASNLLKTKTFSSHMWYIYYMKYESFNGLFVEFFFKSGFGQSQKQCNSEWKGKKIPAIIDRGIN